MWDVLENVDSFFLRLLEGFGTNRKLLWMGFRGWIDNAFMWYACLAQ